MVIMHKKVNLVLILLATAACATELGDLAASMQPGEYAELATNGMSATFLRDTNYGVVLEYSDNAVWNPLTNEYLYGGMGHSGPYGDGKFIKYQESDNTWYLIQIGSPFYGTHGYDHMAINPNDGTIYYRRAAEDSIRQYSGGSWSILSDANLNYVQIANGIEFFPELGATGSIIFCDAYGIQRYDLNSDQWIMLEPNPTMNYHSYAEYSPVHQTVICGGGNGESSVYRIDSNGSIQQMNDGPFNLGVAWGSIITSDPVTGDFLVWGAGGSLYTYNPITDTWTNEGQPAVPYNISAPAYGSDIFGVIAAPIPEHDVVMFLGWNSGNPKVYLYKHSSTNVTTSQLKVYISDWKEGQISIADCMYAIQRWKNN